MKRASYLRGLIVDVREQKIWQHLIKLGTAWWHKHRCWLLQKPLKVGDFWICAYRDECLLPELVVERKTFNDLRATLKDETRRLNIMHMKESCEREHVRCVLLLENLQGRIPHLQQKASDCPDARRLLTYYNELAILFTIIHSAGCRITANMLASLAVSPWAAVRDKAFLNTSPRLIGYYARQSDDAFELVLPQAKAALALLEPRPGAERKHFACGIGDRALILCQSETASNYSVWNAASGALVGTASSYAPAGDAAWHEGLGAPIELSERPSRRVGLESPLLCFKCAPLARWLGGIPPCVLGHGAGPCIKLLCFAEYAAQDASAVSVDHIVISAHNECHVLRPLPSMAETSYLDIYRLNLTILVFLCGRCSWGTALWLDRTLRAAPTISALDSSFIGATNGFLLEREQTAVLANAAYYLIAPSSH